ncbi:oocyte zinc finger protein XlCOF26-like [Apis mellifera carnica]|nr:oocyte zinc finger protein XlCOF26-like [Apis mellifera carnica]
MKELKIENRFQETRVDEVSEKRELEVGSAWKKKKRRQEYKYSCLNCLKSYKRKGHLVEHQRIFCGKDKEQCCPYCVFRTYKKSNLKKHMNRKHCNVIDYDRQVRSLE